MGVIMDSNLRGCNLVGVMMDSNLGDVILWES